MAYLRNKEYIHAVISADSVTVNCEVFSVNLSDAEEAEELNLPKINVPSIILVANTRKTAIRIANIDDSVIIKNGNISQDTQWNLVQKTFPLGEKMNEDTHVFDGSIFVNENGQSQFFIAALPVNICNIFAKIGVRLTGTIHRVARLDTIENILFKKYTAISEMHESVLIFLPQDDGLRLLHITANLPNATHYISYNPLYREDEFLRFYNSFCNSQDSETINKRAIFLKNNTALNWQWLRDILSKYNFSITEEIFHI